MARCVATARVIMPRTVVRLSAGRMNFSFADQALCFMAGANSIFDGDKLLTTPNNDRNEDLKVGRRGQAVGGRGRGGRVRANRCLSGDLAVPSPITLAHRCGAGSRTHPPTHHPTSHHTNPNHPPTLARCLTCLG